jgi:hypothetical protein
MQMRLQLAGALVVLISIGVCCSNALLVEDVRDRVIQQVESAWRKIKVLQQNWLIQSNRISVIEIVVIFVSRD